MCKVLVADDHPLFRQAMQLAIEGLEAHGDPVVLEASSIDEVRRLAIAERDLDLVLLDLRMPGMDGFAGLVALRREFPQLPVVIVSASEEQKIIRTVSGQVIQLEDTGGSEKLVLKDEKNGNRLAMDSSGIVIEDANGNTVTLAGSGIKLEAGQCTVELGSTTIKITNGVLPVHTTLTMRRSPWLILPLSEHHSGR